MNMLEHFFFIEGDKNIFEGLKISKNQELCDEYLSKQKSPRHKAERFEADGVFL